MEFQRVLEERRSIRKFQEQEVEENDIKKIIEASLIAPSAHNRQPWRFKILKGEDKNVVSKLMKEYVEVSNTSDKSIIRTASIIENGNVLILIFNDSNEHYLMDILSIGACIENMCLKATDLKIGSLWIGNCLCVKEKIIEQFDISEGLELVSAVLLGYAFEDAPKISRKKIDEVIL